MIAFYRHPGRATFTEREARIVHIILSEIPSLHEDISPSQLNRGVNGLSPRLRQALNLLIQGYSRNEIADHLELSIHTVGEYNSELYKRFDVNSQTSLVLRFLVGDGGDTMMVHH